MRTCELLQCRGLQQRLIEPQGLCMMSSACRQHALAVQQHTQQGWMQMRMCVYAFCQRRSFHLLPTFGMKQRRHEVHSMQARAEPPWLRGGCLHVDKWPAVLDAMDAMITCSSALEPLLEGGTCMSHGQAATHDCSKAVRPPVHFLSMQGTGMSLTTSRLQSAWRTGEIRC